MTEQKPETLREWQQACWEIAEDHGWHEEFLVKDNQLNMGNVGLKLALLHSEVSEALEEFRNNRVYLYFNGNKPEGAVIELADIIIRVLDIAAALNFDMQKAMEIKTKYNRTRSYRHGGKKA